MNNVIVPFITSFVIAVCSAPLVIKAYKHMGWIDDPKKNAHPKVVHKKAIPRGGGAVIFIAVLFASLFFLRFDKHVIGILLSAFCITLLGVFDDVKDLSPYLRLPLLFLAAAVVVGSGVGIAYLSNPFGSGVLWLNQPQLVFDFLGRTRHLWILADIFGLLWIVWNMTIVNWSKGLDGQMPGFVGIASFVIALLSLRFSADPAQWNVTLLALIVSGAFFGFLVWNIYPQRMMAGYGAGSLAGFFLAVLSILSGAKVATALLVLAIPTIDACYVILRRLFKGKSPLWGDRGHLHHRLMDIGWGKRRIAYFYWITTAVLGFISLQLNSQQKFYTILGIALLFGGFLVWITLFFSSSKQLVRDNG
ncbi:MAG: undecaprenyl/decaprenyl-phosphate alpha-N-acetylglucosaminyl 1-phosphate transferase [Candidatus Pacebacteria bacterium]|nr:undecaprenyl/decaprenyl-phosphate alpha-N-acetylglucosaminyl 1-phosphate transferase [Candidatus Paceibacterota bacterium]